MSNGRHKNATRFLALLLAALLAVGNGEGLLTAAAAEPEEAVPVVELSETASEAVTEEAAAVEEAPVENETKEVVEETAEEAAVTADVQPQRADVLTEGRDDNVSANTVGFHLTGLLLGTFVIRTNNPVLKSVEGTATGIKVSWEPAAGAVRYRVYRKSSSGWVWVGDSAGLSMVDTTAVSGTVNTYTVRCISNDGQSVSEYDPNGIGMYYVAAPDLALSGSKEGISLRWNPVSGAALYRIVKQNAAGGWDELVTTASTAFTDTKAAMGKSGVYQAMSLAADEAPLSCWGAAESLRLMPVPVLKKAKGVYKGIQISWKKVPGAAKYRIYRKNGEKWDFVADTTSTSYKDKSVKKKKKYTYTVACVSKDGKTVESGFSVKGVTGKRKK